MTDGDIHFVDMDKGADEIEELKNEDKELRCLTEKMRYGDELFPLLITVACGHKAKPIATCGLRGDVVPDPCLFIRYDGMAWGYMYKKIAANLRNGKKDTNHPCR